MLLWITILQFISSKCRFTLIFAILYLLTSGFASAKKDLKKIEADQIKTVTKKTELAQKVKVVALARHEKAKEAITVKPKNTKKVKDGPAKPKGTLNTKDKTTKCRFHFKKMLSNSGLEKRGQVLLKKKYAGTGDSNLVSPDWVLSISETDESNWRTALRRRRC